MIMNRINWILLASVSVLPLAASADILINEVLASTTGADSEFFELYNSGASPVDITGWTFAVYESDAGTAFGTEDQLYTIGAFSISAGSYFTAANALTTSAFAITPDETLPDNFFENSSSTYVLRDGSNNVINTIFMTDGGVDDAANILGTPIVADSSFGPDGSFFPAGFYRIGDGSSSLGLLEFGTVPAPTATPGLANVPEPSTYAAILGLLGLGYVMIRRRK